MISLFYKEISGFFSSLTGYLVIIVFLIGNGCVLWWFDGSLNVFQGGYASLETLFVIAPWVFLFLIPAITMRSFTDEQRSGNMELLLTRPLTELQIVLAKYLANLSVAVFSLLPTLFFYFSIIRLGNPIGNIDTGATWGSYIGLLFLAATYISIGLFASSITENTIVAFILAVVMCFFFYRGFNSVGYLSMTGNTGNLILNLGIDAHYKSIRRGVVDSRDVVYFISIIVMFITLAKIKLKSRMW